MLGLASGDGALYALEMSSTPAVPRPAPARSFASGAAPLETVVSGLTFPTGIAVGPDGAFYVSNQGFGFGAGQGQVLRITL